MNAMCLEVLAVQQLSLSAVMTVPTKLRVIRSHFVTKLESLDILSNLHHNTTRLVASHYGHSRVEVTIMDVKISAADSARLDCHSVSSVPIVQLLDHTFD
jgi:hypothetical protein